MASMTGTKNELVKAFFTNEPYKPAQGQTLRYGTLAAIMLFVVTGAYSWMQTYSTSSRAIQWGVPLACVVVFGWLGYRLVHWPRFADFLIGTESEMAKVSWPAWKEVKVSTVVVLVSVVVLSLFLFGTDLFWKFALSLLGILRIGGLMGSGSQNQ